MRIDGQNSGQSTTSHHCRGAPSRGNLLLYPLDNRHTQGHYSNTNTGDCETSFHILSNNTNEGTEKQPKGNRQRRSNPHRRLARLVVDQDELRLRGVTEDVWVAIGKTATVLAESRASEKSRQLVGILVCSNRNLSRPRHSFGILV